MDPAAPAGAGATAPANGSVVADPYLEDPRLIELFAQCRQDGFYDRNVADLLPLLEGKLFSGDGDAQKKAIEELGAYGDQAIPGLSRDYRRLFNDASRLGELQNVLGALSLNQTRASTQLLIEALGHPHSAIRLNALRGLTQHALLPEDAGPLAYSASIEFGAARAVALECLFHADPAAGAALSLDWLENGSAGEAQSAALRGLDRHGPQLPVEPRLRLAKRLDPIQGVYLWAGLLAPEGDRGEGPEPSDIDPQVRDALLEAVGSANSPLASSALEALMVAGQIAWVAHLATEHPTAALRLQAASALGNALWPLDQKFEYLKLPPGTRREAALDALRRLLDDKDQSVREEAWSALLRLGDSEAFERALAALGDSERMLALLVTPLRDCLIEEVKNGRQERVQRALERLLELESEVQDQPLKGWRLRILQTLALVPSARATARLLEVARAAEGRIEGLRAHQWLTIQASNSGEAGRAFLFEALGAESDPARRLDLLWAASAAPSDGTRERLLAFIEQDSNPEAERLFAASRLCQLGPARLVAPVLKRLALRFNDQPRRGLQCLLWRWY